MIMLMNVFNSFLLAHLIVKFEPIGWVLEAIQPTFNKNRITRFFYNLISLALGCFKCSSLYVGFFIGGFWCGVMTSFFAYIYSQSIAPFIDGIRFK